jgi:Ca2+-binding EF-hand superfamily protein
MLLGRIETMLREGDDFSSLNPRQAANLRRAQAAFDMNHNGKLEPEELLALMQFLQGSVK